MRLSPAVFLLLAVLGALAFSGSANAADMPLPPGMMAPEAMQEMQKLNPNAIFGYPGQACPAGSEAYKGPETAQAEAAGVVYCSFVKKTTIYPKKYFEKCPTGMKPYKDDKAKPASDVIWCERDSAYKPQMPALPPGMPPAKNK